MTATSFPRIRCIVAQAEIGARACVDRQTDQGCFCPAGAAAINAVAETAPAGSRLAEALDCCRARAKSVMHASTDERYLGPARDAHEGRKVAPPPLITGELPAGRPPKNADAPPPAAPALPPAPLAPTEETTMARTSKCEAMTKAEFKKALKEHGSIRAASRALGCSWGYFKERLADEPEEAAPEAPAPANPQDKPAEPTSAPVDTLSAEEYLRARLEHAKAKRIELERWAEEERKLAAALAAMDAA